MGKYDLNNAADFARATNSFGAGVLQTFTARGSTDWLIEEGTYQSGIDPKRSVIFHVFKTSKDYGGALSQISDSGGRRKAKFAFPFLDGQLTNDMGREAETFTLEIVLHGNNYLSAFNELLTILNEPTPGTLTHPVRGKIICGMEHYELIHQDSQRKAVAIKLTMTEHSIEALQLSIAPNKSAPSLLSKLTTAFTKIENAINAVQGVVFLAQSVKNQITQSLQAYQLSYSKVGGNMNSTFNAGGNIPALLPVQQGGLQSSTGAIVSNSVTNAISPNDPFAVAPANLLSKELQQALAIDHIQKDIETTRTQIASIIGALEGAGGGQGALEFYDNIVALRETVNDLLAAFVAGKQSSQISIVNFVTPQIMSVREVGFANDVAPDNSFQIVLLNPEIESLNFIPQGTVLMVPVT